MLMSCTVKIAASMAIRCAGEVQGNREEQKPHYKSQQWRPPASNAAIIALL